MITEEIHHEALASAAHVERMIAKFSAMSLALSCVYDGGDKAAVSRLMALEATSLDNEFCRLAKLLGYTVSRADTAEERKP